MIALLLWGCTGESGSKDSTFDETGAPDGETASETADTADTTETAETGETGDTGHSGETSDTEDTGPVDTSLVPLDDVATAKILAEAAADGLAWATSASDVSGDGDADLVIGSTYSNRGGSDGGALFVFDRAPSGVVTAAAAHAVLYAGSNELLGTGFHGARDVNGDGVDDLVLRSSYCSMTSCEGGYEGRAYVAYGPFTGVVDLEAVSAIIEGPFSLYSELSKPLGDAVGAAGDTNGDGFADVLISGMNGVEAFLMTGPVEGFHHADDDAAMRYIDTVAGALATMTSAGDVDGDGMGDIAIGRFTAEEDRVVVFNGPLAGDHSEADPDASFQSAVGYGAGLLPVISVGDLDHDGYGDLAMGSYIGETTDVRGVYLEFGPFAGTIDLTAAPVSLVSREDEIFGSAVALAGDVDADGEDDLLLGEGAYAFVEYPVYAGAGRACLVFGPFAGTIEISSVGTCWKGDGADSLGASVAGPGDLDDDGFADLLVGGPGDDDAGEDAGAVWLLSGATVHRR